MTEEEMQAFKVGGHDYRLQPMTVPQQFDVVRQLGPALTMLALNTDDAAAKFPRAFSLVAGQLPKLDVDAAVAACLGTLSRAVGDKWSPVSSGGTLMYQDISLTDMMMLVHHVLEANGLISFFVAPQSASEEVAPGPPSNGRDFPADATGYTGR